MGILLFPLTCAAQTDAIQSLLENCIDEESEEEMELLYEHLSEIAANPININNVTESQDQLKELLFLSPEQVDDIVEYVVRYGPVRSKSELMMIPSLDINTRQLLSSLITLGESDRQQRTAAYYQALQGDSTFHFPFSTLHFPLSNKSELTASIKIPFTPDKNADKYNGSNLKHWLRGTYSINSHLKVGFLASQDAGEPFFSGKNKTGYDLYSAYLQMKNIRLGGTTKLKNLVVGRFRIRSATGLILNTGNTFRSFGVSSFSSLPSTQVSITPGISRSEASTMQGLAATIAFGQQWEASFFASYRNIDATIAFDADSTENIATILRTGYHRTDSELNRKHNATETSAGVIVGYHDKRMSLGFTGVYDHYSLPLQPYEEGSSVSKLYKKFNPTGQDFLNLSVNYAYRLGKRLTFHGETATTSLLNSPLSTFHFPLSTLNALTFRTSKTFTLSLLQRFYPYRFTTTLGRSFSAGGSNQDESGIYLAANWNPSSNLSLSAYTDIAYFAWPKYQALGSTHSFDNMVQMAWKLDSRQTINLRYRLRMRERDADNKAAGYTLGDLMYKNEHRLRASYEWSERGNRPGLVLLSKIDMSYCDYKQKDYGVMVSQDAVVRMKNVDFTASAGYFNTTDYNARIYSYEHSTPYSLSFPSFYGQGLRTYALADATLLTKGTHQLSLITKLELTHYLTLHEEAKNQSALSLSLRWTM